MCSLFHANNPHPPPPQGSPYNAYKNSKNIDNELGYPLYYLQKLKKYRTNSDLIDLSQCSTDADGCQVTSFITKGNSANEHLSCSFAKKGEAGKQRNMGKTRNKVATGQTLLYRYF